MPWSPPSDTLPTALSTLPRTPSLPPPHHRIRKTVSFSPSSSLNHASPSSHTAPATTHSSQADTQLPSATFHRFRRLEQLLEPSPSPANFARTRRLPFAERTNAAPFLAGRMEKDEKETAASRTNRVRRDEEEESSFKHKEEEEEKSTRRTASMAVQTTPTLSRSTPRMDTRPGKRSPMSRNKDEAATLSPPKVSSPPSALPATQPSPRPSPRHSSPPSVPATALAPALAPAPTSEPILDLPPTPLPPLSSAAPSPLSPPFQGWTTLGLAPFRYALSSTLSRRGRRGRDGRSTEEVKGKGDGDSWVELLPPSPPASASSTSDGVSGEILLDLRKKDGKVWLFSPDGQTVTLFRPPSSSSSSSAPLVLLHPLRTWSAAELFDPSPVQSAEDQEGTEKDVKEKKEAKRAWKVVEKVLKVVRSRTVLMTFHPSPSLLDSLTISSSPSSCPSALVASFPRPKCTIFSDGNTPSPSSEHQVQPASYSLSFSLSPGKGGGKAEVFVSPSRDFLSLTRTLTLSAPTTTNPSKREGEGEAKRWSGRLSSFLSDPTSLQTFLSSFPSSLPRTDLLRLVHLLSLPSSPFAQAVERVRRAHLAAVCPSTSRPASPPPPPPPPQPSTRTVAVAVEAQLVRILCSSLALPLPPLLPRPPSSTFAFPSDRAAQVEEKRCLPGLGWITRRLRRIEGKEEEGAREYEVLFADGDRVVLHVDVSSSVNGEQKGGVGGAEEDGKDEEEVERVVKVEVEDRKGRRFPIFPSNLDLGNNLLPVKIKRRMGLVVEMLTLFLSSGQGDEGEEGDEGVVS